MIAGYRRNNCSLGTEFGEPRDEVEANANPYYKACALVANRSEVYNPVVQLKHRISNEKPFTEFTVLPDNALSQPFNFTDPFSEDHDEDSDADILLRNLINACGHEDSGFDVDAVNRDLCCKDVDEESDCDSQTSTEDTPVAPSTENDRNANEDIDIIDLTSEDDSDGTITTPKMTGAASAPQSTELSDGAITTPKMTGVASAPQPIELIQKVAQRIANGEKYRTVCVALGFNLNENKRVQGV